MNIGMLLNAPYPSDIRVKKEAGALIAGGHRVFLLCLRKHGQAVDEMVDGIHVHRIDAGKNNYGLAFWDMVMSISFRHPIFERALGHCTRTQKLDVLHVHDLPLAGSALHFSGKKSRIPVIVDLHENYPEGLRSWFAWKRNPIVRLKNRIFMNPSRWTRHEKEAVTKSDAVIAVVEEMKARLIRDHGISPAKITVVTNTESVHFMDQEVDPSVYSNFAGKFILAYTGSIGPHRGVDTMIEGLSLVENKKVIAVISGSGSKAVMRLLSHLAKKHRVEDRVFFDGYQPFGRFYSLMHFANVNVIPHHSNGHTNNTIPHKLYQSMLAGRPLLVSSCPPLKRVVEETGSGLVFEAGNSHDFADKVRQLVDDDTLCKKMGKEGMSHALKGTYNWEHTQEQLLTLYGSFGT